MQNSVPEIPVIGCGVCTRSHMSKPRTLLSRSTRNETNKPTQSLKRTLIKVGRSSEYWFELLTVISKMQYILEFNDVRSISVIRLDRRYDTQAPPMRRSPSPSYADSVSSCYVGCSTALIEHAYSSRLCHRRFSLPANAANGNTCWWPTVGNCPYYRSRCCRRLGPQGTLQDVPRCQTTTPLLQWSHRPQSYRQSA